MWNKKHAQAVIIPSEREKGTSKFRFGNVIALGEGTDFDKFLFSFINSYSYYDPGNKIENISSKKPKQKTRNQIRIKAADLSILYDKCEEINLLTLK